MRHLINSCGGLRSSPSAFCMITESSQRPNFQPTSFKIPICSKPALNVQLNGRPVVAIANDANHLPRTPQLTIAKDSLEQ